ncbi:MAG: glycoside hydrolase family 9 protein [Bacteroidales bacterium]|nr:glycoside hydrolase family 9 protein [Bacteroidales bacterium]
MKILLTIAMIFVFATAIGQNSLFINEQDYFEMDGLDVIVFSDFYPGGHQSGVTIVQHGIRVAANGDLRLEPAPGQWSPVPKGGDLKVDREKRIISKTLWYPDSSRNRKGFNPINYPDLVLHYTVSVIALDCSSFRIVVDLDKPLPEDWVGKAGFNLELFPGDLFGKSYLMDQKAGIFPTQPNGPVFYHDEDLLTQPLANGSVLVVAPEEDLQRMTISSEKQHLELWDDRSNHNNGWFKIRSIIPAETTKGAVEWIITPNVMPGWHYKPVVQVSQIGYHPEQKKIAILEMDKKDEPAENFKLYKLGAEGRTLVKTGLPDHWGRFLRYNYATMDFSGVSGPGMYQLSYGKYLTHPFKIDGDVFERHAWQPTLEYYLPVQMCHMRVNEKYRVWHDCCHLDDAVMAPLNITHFDGYSQGSSTLCDFKPMETLPGLNRGGWHDAGDYDLRVESQMGTVWMLALMIEEFGLDYDATLIDPEQRLVEIHVPDGKSDAIQQIEHGLASVLGGYRSMGRLYRGIICPAIRQYVLLGDAAAMTDNLFYNDSLNIKVPPGIFSGIADDRWVFTEDNPRRELYVTAALSAAFRVLKESNPDLADEALKTALDLWSSASQVEGNASSKVIALSELILSTNDPELKKILISLKEGIISDISRCGWAVGHMIHLIEDKKFRDEIASAVREYQQQIKKQTESDSPYGVPYKPHIWGAGWNIQQFGVEQYFFNKGWPELTTTEFFENALNFILGVHPGINTSSFASGVGSKSVTVAYGVNRADWSFIPGGVVSGTALIRPDLPELKIWPYLWQQTEYVMGGGATNYMFLVMAVDALYKQDK